MAWGVSHFFKLPALGLHVIWIPHEGNTVLETVFPAETLVHGARVSGALGVPQKGAPMGVVGVLGTVHAQISEHWRFDVETDLHLEIV